MKDKIIIKGAREHNLKNINIELPRNKLIVFTGVSGSGKSSLAFDTLYAEGQRKYIESLSSYARQFLGQMEKPELDHIEGLSPAISIQQKAASKNPRSTVGTVTEIYDYLRVLFARIGTQHCYNCGKEVGSQSAEQMVNHIMEMPLKTKIQILAPVAMNKKGTHKDIFENAKREGFVRARVNGKIVGLDEEIELDKKRKHNIEIVVDRIIIRKDIESRLTDSIEAALKAGEGIIRIHNLETDEIRTFSEHNACVDCGISYGDLSPQNFSFNSSLGMCPNCNGLGYRMELDEKLLIPDHSLSIHQGAVKYWGELTGKKSSWRYKILKRLETEFGIDLKKPFKELTKKQKDILLHGSKKKMTFNWSSDNSSGSYSYSYEGLLNIVARRMKETSSEEMKKYYLQFYSNHDCEFCNGSKLRKESNAVNVNKKTIFELSSMSIRELINFLTSLELTETQKKIAHELLKEIIQRLQFLNNVGLHYLNLNRSAPTLSGGESQRIRLASQIGSGLVGVMYILDEPSIGLHQRDNQKLIETLTHLRDIGNSVLVVEHDEETIRSADYVLDIGPGAGIKGGEIVYFGDVDGLLADRNSLTGKYLNRDMTVSDYKKKFKKERKILKITDVKTNNLKSVTAEFPIGKFICVTGVSGSGKSSLINQTLYPAVYNKIAKNIVFRKEGEYGEIKGVKYIDKIINIDQKPIGRTPRSNPATYVGVFTPIRDIFAQLPESKLRGYKPGRFSFNVKGGRCETCAGDGLIKVEMHFIPDVYVTCEDCKGLRYNRETLQIRFKGKNIAEILDMEVAEALELFENVPKIKKVLQVLVDVGLEYIKLGQSATTLSGGEAQRVKLAKELCRQSTGKTLYILDEPTTGLHFHDVKKLLEVLNKLVEKNNTVVVIEHNLDVIKNCDHIIDIGPEGGDEGGEILFSGHLKDIKKIENSYTGRYL